jgi:ribosomal protein S18 acetylase RimI-like enzyme
MPHNAEPPCADPALTSVIRVATRADEDAVRRVIAAAYAEFAAVLPPALFDAYLENLLDLDARRNDALLLVAEVDGVVAGAVTFYPDAAAEGFGWPSGWAGFRALAVDPDYRGRGIARALVAACIARAVGANAEVIGLHTAAFMEAAVAIYEAIGFVRAPEFDIHPVDVVGIDDPDAPAVVAYKLALRSA